MTENISIQYYNFNPTYTMQAYVHSIMNHLQEEAPYKSNLKAVITLTEEGLRASIQIISPIGYFFATDKGPNKNLVIRKLYNKIRNQLNKWKTTRFLNAPKYRGFENQNIEKLTFKYAQS